MRKFWKRINGWIHSYLTDHDKHGDIFVKLIGMRYSGDIRKDYSPHLWIEKVQCRICGKIWERPERTEKPF